MSRLLRSLFARLEEGADDGTKGGAGSGAASAANTDDKTETFSREYVKELREENKNWRLKAQQTEKERDDHKTAAEKAATEAADKVKAAQSAADERILRSELKAAALKAGMIDLDGLKLADLTKVKLNDDGTVEGADTLFEDMKKAKPYLFGKMESSSPTKEPPPKKPGEAKNAKDMTDEEYADERKKIK